MKRGIAAQAIARRGLDLDDVGALLGEHPRDHRPADALGGFDDAHAVERWLAVGHVVSDILEIAHVQLYELLAVPSQKVHDGLVERPRGIEVDGVAGVDGDGFQIRHVGLGVPAMLREALLALADDEQRRPRGSR